MHFVNSLDLSGPLTRVKQDSSHCRTDTTPMPTNTTATSPWGTACESQTLRRVPLWAARLGRSLRSRSYASFVCEVRRRTTGVHQPLSTRSPQEAKMRNSRQCLRNGAVKRCALCGGKFGLIRHYTWRTALCSRKCVDGFKARQDGDRRWLLRAKTA